MSVQEDKDAQKWDAMLDDPLPHNKRRRTDPHKELEQLKQFGIE